MYAIGPPAIRTMLAKGFGGGPVKPVGSDCDDFWSKGFLALPGILAAEAPRLRQAMDAMLKAGAGRATKDWNAVNTGGAEFVLQVDAQGEPIPGSIMKVQGAGLASPPLLEALASSGVQAAVRRLYGALGQEVPAHVDVFGTKFFPMWPGGTSVSWHQDCHFFGTASPRIISCAIYLEDTDAENGCLQVVPGSHTRGVLPHRPGSKEWAQGEWYDIDEQEEEIQDVAVPAGSVVLFNAMLLHAARRNTHNSRTRYSVFGHFLPASLSFSWRGTDFSREAYRDRHPIY